MLVCCSKGTAPHQWDVYHVEVIAADYPEFRGWLFDRQSRVLFTRGNSLRTGYALTPDSVLSFKPAFGLGTTVQLPHASGALSPQAGAPPDEPPAPAATAARHRQTDATLVRRRNGCRISPPDGSL